MTTEVIDVAFHGSSFPSGNLYTGPGTIIGNPKTASGVVEKINGNFTSNGNAVQIRNGFRPMHIKVINTTDGITWEWQSGMPAANSVKTVLGGSLTSAQDTGSAFTITTDFAPGNICSVTLSATVCGTAKNICYEIEG